MALHYLIGDATEPVKRPAIICHCCNNSNKWGSGFVVPLGNKYPESKKAYHEWFHTGDPVLGDVQFVYIRRENYDICVANLIGQHGVRWQGKTPPIRYNAIAKGLERVYQEAIDPKFNMPEPVSVHMPRMGAVLAGGNWQEIEKLINLSMGGVETYVYTLESQKDRWPTDYE